MENNFKFLENYIKIENVLVLFILISCISFFIGFSIGYKTIKRINKKCKIKNYNI